MQVIAGSAHTANRLALLYLLSYGYADGGAVGEQIVKCIVVQYLDVIPILAALGGDAFPFMAVAFSQSGELGFWAFSGIPRCPKQYAPGGTVFLH